MRASWKLAAVFIVAGLAGTYATVPAYAGTATPTSFGFFQDDQASFNYIDPTITLSGTLRATAVTPNTPIANEPVTVTEQVAGTGPTTTVGSATTDSNGNFTVTLTDQPAGGIFEAVFAGDTSNGVDYAPTTSSPLKVIPNFSDVDVTYTTTPKSPVAAGTTVTFSGQVFVPANDGGTNPQTPIVGANVYVFSGSEPRPGGPHTVTTKDGRFTVSVKPTATATYHVKVAANEPWPYCLYICGAIVNNTKVTVLPDHRRTRVERFKVPALHEIHGNFEASGTVQELSSGKWHAAGSATVALYYRSLRHGNWTLAGSVKTGSSGAFAWNSQVLKLGKFKWQARVKQTTVGSIEYRPSDSAAKDSFSVDRTFVTHFVAIHLHGGTSLAAIIQDYPESGGVHYANVTGIAKFYYKRTGSKKWRLLGKSRATRANGGSVAIDVAGTLDGRFKIVFPAQGDFLGSSRTQSLR